MNTGKKIGELYKSCPLALMIQQNHLSGNIIYKYPNLRRGHKSENLKFKLFMYLFEYDYYVYCNKAKL